MFRVGIICRVVIDSLHFEYIGHLTVKTVKSLVNGGDNNPRMFFRLGGLRTFGRRRCSTDIYFLLRRIRQYEFIVGDYLQVMVGSFNLFFRVDVVVTLQKLVVALP